MSFGIVKSRQNVSAGGGSDPAKVGGTLSINTTAVGTDADTVEKTLMSYSLPANTLLKNGQGVRVKAWGTTGANANTKAIKSYFGAGEIKFISAIAYNGLDWRIEGEVFRTGVGAQESSGMHNANGQNTGISQAEPSEDETAAIIIKLTGQNGIAAANDIVCEGMSVEFINN